MSASATKWIVGAGLAYLAYRALSAGPAPMTTVATGTAPAGASDALSPLISSLAVIGRNFFDPPASAGPVVGLPGFIP